MKTSSILTAVLMSEAVAGGLASAQATKTTTITSYVTTVQEERQSTRFTLTEWLRIKERMKLMDVYLAMFSNPKKDDFSPELHLGYMATRGSLRLASGSGNEDADMNGDEGRAQFWLTNLVTSTVGLRMLNVDLGVEVYQRSSGDFTPTAGSASTAASFSAVDASPNMSSTRRALTRYGSANFRIFGKSIQDSSLVAKVGRYEYTSSLLQPQSEQTSTAATDTTPAYDARVWRGVMTGVDMQMYVFNWFGAEGTYNHFGGASPGAVSEEFSGATYSYGPFIEISLLHLSVGRYAETWKFLDRDGLPAQVTGEGLTAGAKLNF